MADYSITLPQTSANTDSLNTSVNTLTSNFATLNSTVATLNTSVATLTTKTFDLFSLSVAKASHQYVAASTNTGNFTTSDQRTFSCWIKMTSVPGAGVYGLISKMATTGAPGFEVCIEGYDTPSNNARLGFVVHDGTNGWRQYGNTTISTNTWYHCAVVYPGGGRGNVIFYINGSADGNNNGNTFGNGNPSDFSNGAPIEIATDPPGRPGNNGYFDGLIDDVAIFPSTLSAGNITTIYNSGRAADVSSFSPLVYLKLENNYTDSGSLGLTFSGVNNPSFSSTIPG